MPITCRETLDMVAATVGQADQFAAGQLLGKVMGDRMLKTGDESLIVATHQAMQVIRQPMRTELMEGFAKSLYFDFLVPKHSYLGGGRKHDA